MGMRSQGIHWFCFLWVGPVAGSSKQRMHAPLELPAERQSPLARLSVLQVCLAAETCGHVDFNTRGDVWYSSEPFHCGDIPPGHVTYWQIFCKVSIRRSA